MGVWVSTLVIFLGCTVSSAAATLGPLSQLESGIEVVVVLYAVGAMIIGVCAVVAFCQYLAVFKRKAPLAIAIGVLFLALGAIGFLGAVRGVAGLLGFLPLDSEYYRWQEVWIPLGVFLAWIAMGSFMLKWGIAVQRWQATSAQQKHDC